MLEGSLQLFVISFIGLVSFGQPRVVITDKNQAETLQTSAEHHIVFPYLVDGDGTFLSHNIHHRTRRSLESPELHYHVPFKNEGFHLELKPNDGLMVSGLEVEWRSGKRSRADRNCHFIGSVRNYTKSSVAISNCRGLAGLIRAEHGREFFIEPVLGLEPSEHDGKHAHVIYRRSVGEGLDKNITEPACGVTVEDVQDRDHFEEEEREEGKGFYVRRRSKRSVSLMKHVEILLVADYSMTKYYSDRDLETYLFTIMNMLSLVFRHRSIGSAINVVLVRMIIIDTEHEKGLNVTNHARKSLNTFCKWVKKNNPPSDFDPQHADAAVLVTRKDICRNSYKPCSTLGLSNIDGMCTAGSECSYNQDTGFTLVYTIAHELGHNLGALHDDDYSSCRRLRKYIMASNLVVDPADQVWSKCTKKAIKSFFYKGWGWCLNDRPAIDLQPKLPRRMLPGERFDADAQCKMLFGANSTICSGTETGFCKTLWCVHSTGLCATKHVYGRSSGFPALDGTPCGKKKYHWCYRGKCIKSVVLDEPIDGGWGGWSGWSDCSQSCGRGVKRRIRKCNSPRPEHGGFYCIGEWKRHSICNEQACPKGSDNPVQIQCKKFRALLVNGRKYDWSAKQNHRNPCELRCIPVLKQGRSRIRKFIQAQDGTPCNHGTRNICIQGKCEHVGCDNRLYSSAREDRCGVCRGDGSTCETKHDSFDKPEGEGYTEALVIPAHSRNIVIQEASGSPNFLALRSASGDYFLNGNWYIQWSGDYDVAGASGHYSRRHNRETFKTKGPITEDLHVLLLYQGKNTGLKAQYDVKRNETIKPRYFHWKYSLWTPCSVTCGHGVQRRAFECVDQENNVADKMFCKNKYRYRKRLCRRKKCPPSWWVGVWHECSKTCGHAVKFRVVLCTQIVRDRREIIDKEKCEGEKKPTGTTICQQPLCWTVHPWSNCTSMCGPGFQYRLVQCPGNASQCDISTKPLSNRTCVGNTCSEWRIGDWGECSASCGSGTQIRNVSCEHYEESMCWRDEKPMSNRPCPSVPCPVWRAGAWSECSVSCGKGVETRNATCEQGHVNFTCNVLERPAVVRSCLKKPCSGWTVGEWSSCSASCGKGIRERKVVCTLKSCTASTRPKHEERCVMRECPKWSVTKWTECSVSCGEGLQYRNITCNDPIYPCSEDTEPASVQPCLNSECSIWSFGNWSECSLSCGSGVQTRSIICNAATQKECEKATPVAERPCNEQPCLTWETGNWSECSRSCGPGIQERSVWCPSNSCDLQDKPNATRPCLNPDCAVWVTGNWGECPVSCGEGVQTRQVYCGDDDESECDALEMPESTRDCFVSRCGAWIVTRWGQCSAKCGLGYTTRNATCSYPDARNCSNKPKVVKMCQETACSKWSTGQWSPCSVTCNRGFQRRIVSCHGGGCLASTKPLSRKQCVMPSCGQWIPGNWSECSATCGDGVQIRDVRCSEADPKECTVDTKPVIKRFCNKRLCPHWSVRAWGTCSSSCGNGTQSRNVSCVGGAGCSNLTKPVEHQLCFSGECPRWVIGNWIPCSRSCGRGIQIRLVYCKGQTDSSCDSQVRPISGQRCNNVPCPHWALGQWSDCSKSCNGGIRTRNVSCNNSHVGECSNENKPSTTQDCGALPCPKWIAGQWTECSKSCNGGIRTRNVSCNNSHVGECSNEDKPNTTQDCGELPCPQWIAGQWTECSRSCNGGTRTRIVICNNSHVGECLEIGKPTSSLECGQVPCPNWSVGQWSQCSKSCNGGLKIRNVTCQNSHIGECLEEDKPATNQACAEVPCPEWSVGEWSTCSKSCNNGIQTRTVTCKNNRVGKCLSTDRPDNSRRCSKLPCPEWSVGEWSKCSKTCGGGIQKRTVSCNNSHVGKCPENDKPPTNQTCSKTPCPEWSVGEWSKCSKSCGGGLQTRTAICNNSHVGKCPENDKPPTNQTCSKTPCPEWSVGEWSKCSKSCGGGLQTRTAICNNSHVGKCPENDKPPTNKTCSKIPCPEWSVGEWSKCSKSCGGGLQTRTIFCENNHVGRCKAKTKPAAKLSCDDVPCPQWTVSEWSPCSKSCNTGMQYRSVACNNSHIGECLSKDKPHNNQSCSEIPCPQWAVGRWTKCSKSCAGGLKFRLVICKNSHVGECSPVDKPRGVRRCRKVSCPTWLVGEWSECSKSCGGSGVQTRNISCRNNRIGLCEEKSKPVDNQECGEVPCPEWSVGTWSKCSKSCGGSRQTRTVTCENGHIGKCPASERPSTNQKCAELPCPRWFVGDWSTCSKSCDSGTQTRNVVCLNDHVGDCLRNDKPAINQSCGNVPCPRWTVGSWGECSRSCDGGFQTRTVQCNNSHVGNCPRKERPTANQTCGELLCPKWTVDSWSKCSKSCGGGVKYRTVTCENNHVGECKEAEKPRDTKGCRKVPCPEWSVGEWSKCSKSCDGGTQKRTVFCNNSHVGECFARSRPDGTKKCADVPCPVWSAGRWSKCSKSCDGGTQTRKVTCKNNDVGECLLSIKPVSDQKCSEVPCPQWVVGQWSECSRSCNGGIQSRNVTCQNSDVGDCLVKEKPATTQNCSEVPCPKWSVGEWSKCSKSCGGGLQVRNVVCKNYRVGKCSDKDKPASDQNCSQLPCPRWSTGSWSKCSRSCGGGIKYRRVTCANNQIGDCVAAEKPRYMKRCHRKPCPVWSAGKWSKCSKSCNGGIQTRAVTCENKHVGECLTKNKPRTSQKCAKVPCPVWSTEEWSKCSKTCNGGIQTRIVTCNNSHVGDCLVTDKPSSTRNCSDVPCPVWSTEEWSRCSKTCNGGIQTRIVTCNNSHVGDCLVTDKPSSTRKCSDVPCPVWSAGEWSKCSKSCNGGIQTRIVTCNNSHVGDCLMTDKPSSTRKCSDVPCPIWSTEEWSKCSKTCNGGIQTRIVTCNNSHVGDCLVTDKPSSTRKCSDVPCPVWSAGKWSKCSKTCNSGIQMRIVKCNNRHVGDCQAAARPGRFRKCNEVPCPKWSVGQWSPCTKSCDGGIQTRNVACENIHIGTCTVKEKPSGIKNCGQLPCPKWSVGQWSDCSKSCNGGIQGRTVKCINSHVGECVVADKPDGIKTCSDVPCPEWSAGDWSKCSKTCNGGIQTRKVTCKNSHIGDCLATDKPSATEKCGQVSCPRWFVGEWSQCSKSCDGGIQTRTVTCLNSHVGACDESKKPDSTKSCRDLPCPKWSAGTWSKCSKSCDGGIQTRTVTCQNRNIGACDESGKPDSTKSCGKLPCPKWSVGNWSKCSKSCDGGTRKRAVFCRNRNIGACDEDEKPDSTKSCGKLSCPKWSAGEWSKCSKSCDGGVQTRSVSCENKHVGQCLSKDKPTDNQKCGELPCPRWSVGTWAKCSKSCGGGLTTRLVTCQNSDVGACSEKDKPNETKKCREVPCPQWIAGVWSKCSKSCDGGVQTRVVSCKNSHVGKCTEKNKPDPTQSCSEVPCPEWSVGTWSKCSKSCDGGTQTRAVTCKNDHVGKCPEKDKPDTAQSCSEVPCPEWSVGVWSKCSKSCDGGTQTRAVTCKNDHVGKCPEKDKPDTAQSCSEVPCPEWSVGTWSKCSKSCDGGTQTRAVTCKNNHVGKCPEKDKPDTHQICSEVPCPEWSAGSWSKCSNSCDGGTQTRVVTCKNDHVGSCLEERKPPSIQTCGEISCPKWIVGNWHQCSKSCGSGERTRTVQCSGGSTLPCEGAKPASGEVCNDIACPVWVAGNWTKCKARRCPKGKRSRVVVCSWENRRDCDRKTRPVSRQRCVAECPEWKTSEWSECRGSCTKGIMSRRVWCEGGDRLCKLNKKPVVHKPCQRSSCLVWETGDWNVCPVTCGGGLRGRNVRCVNQETGDLVQGCERAAKPMKFQSCALNECPSSPDDIKPTTHTKCRQAIKHTYFCNLLLRPSLSELCFYKQWKRKCCKNCLRINAQRRVKK